MTDEEFMIDFTSQDPVEARDFEPVPRGKYLVSISDGELKECGPDSKNPGKPYAALETTVQGGPYEGRKIFTNVMLFPDKNGKMISAMNLLTATGKVARLRTSEFVEHVLGTDVVVQVTVTKETEKYPAKNEIRGYFPASAGVTAGANVTALRPTGTGGRKKSMLPS